VQLLLRAVAMTLAVTLAVGPISVATASAADRIIAQANQMGTVHGAVTENTGAPIPGATVTATGPVVKSTVTGGDGTYSLSLPPGVYNLNATKTGYESATQTDYVILAGASGLLNVSLVAITLTSLREIGRISVSRGRSTFNSSPASVAIISNQAFADQGQLQVARILDQTPGIVIEHPGTSSNNAVPGAITFPAIRGGLGFETASLLDGHPLAVQTFGDYVTTFLNSDVMQGVELIKGPGAAAPEINYAVNGTVNFRTLDPTSKPSGSVKVGMDSYGGQFSNFKYSNTFGNKFGFVLDYAINGSPGPLQNTRQNVPVGSWFLNCPTIAATGPAPTCQAVSGFQTNAFSGAPTSIQNNPFQAATAVACCVQFSSTYNNKTELVKLRYNISPATVATVSYLGSQTWADQNGNTSIQFNNVFCPGNAAPVTQASCTTSNGYTGPITPGNMVTTAQSVFFPPEFEINNEPIFQAELRSSIGRDTILGRYYTASINRTLQDSFSNPLSPFSLTMTINGVLKLCPPSAVATTCAAGSAVNTVFNNVPVAVTQTGDYFEQTEEDKLHGASFEYDHYMGDSGNVLSFSYDQVNANTDSYSVSGASPTTCAAGSCAANTTPIFPSISIWGGSSIKYTTALVRGIFQLGPKLNVTLSNYFDGYSQTFTSNGGANTTTFPFAATTFQTITYGRYDGRLGIAYRPNGNMSWRFSAGSAVAPPYLNLLDSGASAAIPKLDTTASGCNSLCAKNTEKTGTLRPETSFGYDVGADMRLSKDGLTVLSFDGYLNNLQNQFITTTTFQNGTVTVCNGNNAAGIAFGPAPCATGVTPVGPVPLFTSGSLNLANSRYMGVEMKITRDPLIGFGGTFQMALIRAYPYNLSPCLYSTTVVAGVQNCNGVQNTNLGIISGANFFASGPSGSGTFNVISNHGIPYSQGYSDIHFRTPRGGYVSFGAQYYGPNNSLNLPAFATANASARFPIYDGSWFGQVSADNLFNAYPSSFGSQFAGVAIPLINGKFGLTNANTLGPTVLRFTLTKKFGN